MNEIRIDTKEGEGKLVHRVTEPGYVYLDPLGFEVHPRITVATINLHQVQGGAIVSVLDATRTLLLPNEVEEIIAKSAVFADESKARYEAMKRAHKVAEAYSNRRPDLSYKNPFNVKFD